MSSDPLAVFEEDEPPKHESKKERKRRKAEARAEREAEELPPEPVEVGDVDRVTEAEARRGVRRWLRPAMYSLDHDRIVAATKSSLLIAVNGLMLAITAHALFRDPPAGPLWWPLIPLALTNILSLAFATFSAQAGERPAAIDEPWPHEGETGDRAAVQRWGQARRMLTAELGRRRVSLARSRLHLRTAYRVLVGGMALSALTLAASLALSRRAEATRLGPPAAVIPREGK